MKAKKSTLFCVVVAVIITSLLAYRFTRGNAGRIATHRNDSGSVLDIELKTSNDSRYVTDAGTTVPRRNDSKYVVDIELKKGNNSKYVVDAEQKKSEKNPDFFLQRTWLSEPYTMMTDNVMATKTLWCFS